ncbi:MAG: transcription antitermination factor NusB [Rickettsiales bacterium]|nr:transcription antitermination factor NusB [Rickettsiales bacterium]|tara:strand:- start:726 stop:1190 length:465 start_codon:yes stop_codon:yes gene_type:complete
MGEKAHISLARYLSIQAIYQYIETGHNLEEILIEFNSFHVKNIIFDFENSYANTNLQVDKKYFNSLIKTYQKEKTKIDKLIQSNLKDDWTIIRLPKVVQAIVKIAVAEMLGFPKLSIKIIASEYIILTESFFSKNESSFVNALIQNIYDQLYLK